MADDMTADEAMPAETGVPEDEFAAEAADPAMQDAGMMEACMPEDANAMAEPAADEMMQGMVGMDGVELLPVGQIDPGALEPHPYADLLPRMTEHELAALKDTIELDGLQVPVTLFGGKLLDGRNRCQVCTELGLMVNAVEFSGTDGQAFTHVLTANQYHRDMSKPQRAAVAATLLPHITEAVRQNRAEKVRLAWERKRERGCLSKMTTNLDASERPVSARAIAAQMMQVSDGYVANALRIQQEAPELFEQLHAGKITLQDALRKLDGTVSDAQTRQIKTARRRLNRVLSNLETHPGFLDRFEAFLDEFDDDE